MRKIKLCDRKKLNAKKENNKKNWQKVEEEFKEKEVGRERQGDCLWVEIMINLM